jgi:hypothetical protein
MLKQLIHLLFTVEKYFDMLHFIFSDRCFRLLPLLEAGGLVATILIHSFSVFFTGFNYGLWQMLPA